MQVNDPGVLAQVDAVFDAYESALVGNDVEALDALFWDSPLTLRYGATENLVGIEAIRDFRKARPAAGLAREIVERHVTAFGADFAVANIVFRRAGQARLGRQTQTRVRMPDGWKVVAAHVSWMGT
ncbi:oxalurate catabolism protein HpxZ [Ramlibacter terrae]|uniref:Oxalurate catabolism protein HpxZ n=1 Tax=Ramlibacter terrae TaxID=2732511 RepID=A0ABX6P020_9BURK|nr:oxalurate catabolism protein HpxZ [Ramlibacter terrae]